MTCKTRTLRIFSILCVEDDQVARELLRSALALRFSSLQLYTAEDGEAGLAMYRAHRPDIVITDINMPVMDGIQLVKEIRSLNQEAVLIVMSARSSNNNRLALKQSGVSNFVSKPIDYAKLFTTVTDCMETLEGQTSVEKPS